MNKLQIIFYLIPIAFGFSFQINQLQASEHILAAKLGAVKRDDNTNHLVDSNSFDLDDDTVLAAGFTYLYRMDNGIAFGVDTYGYENEIISTANNSGDVTTGHVYAVVTKFFNIDSTARPYIGVGAGLVSLQFDANISGEIADDFADNATGLSYEVILGSEFQISNSIGMMIEYKYFDFDVDDDIDDRNIEIKSDGHAVMFGVSFHL